MKASRSSMSASAPPGENCRNSHHHHRHHVGVGQVLHPEFLDPAVFGLAGAPSDDGHRE